MAATLDALKAAGFRWATRSGVTISIEDVVTPPRKAELLADAEGRAEKVQTQFERGLITDLERRQELIEIWTRATDEVADAMREHFPRTNPVFMMVNSGARGNWMQVRQIAGMRGLVANPKGEIIPRPIKSNFREGLSVLEYFIATHGARKGLADTALRTADSGYLTRRLVDVSQDVIIREVDCGTDRGLAIADRRAPGRRHGAPGRQRGDLRGVPAAVRGRGRRRQVTVAPAGQDLGLAQIDALVAAGVTEIKARSVLTCESKVGTCATCYGRSLATGLLVDVGEAIGIVAAQSIGEPGTQLTMRTFHTGGVAGEDITHGLPRVVELFEARTPKGVAPISEAAGRVRIDDSEKVRKVIVTPDDGSEEMAYSVSKRSRLLVEDGQHVDVGDKLIHGAVDPQAGAADPRAAGGAAAPGRGGPGGLPQPGCVAARQAHRDDRAPDAQARHDHRRRETPSTCPASSSSGACSRVRTVASSPRAASRPRRRPELMGITKASLATESWLSAASFQETTRVLTDAAIHAKSDPLLGLKENVILGKLIPAGTGMPQYRNVKVEPTEEAKAAMYASLSAYDDLDYGTFGTGGGQAVAARGVRLRRLHRLTGPPTRSGTRARHCLHGRRRARSLCGWWFPRGGESVMMTAMSDPNEPADPYRPTEPYEPRAVPPAAQPAQPTQPYGQPAYGQPTYGQAPGYPAATATASNDAVVALVLSICSWLFCPVVLAVVALVFAGKAKRAIEASNGWVTGDGMVTAAKVISWINIAVTLVIAVIFVIILVVAAVSTSTSTA